MSDEDIPLIGTLIFVYEIPHKCMTAYITSLGHYIKEFMQYYRTAFPHATVLPKMHFLESHLIEWLQKWKTGLGMMGEQGSESIHARFNSLRASYRSIPNPLERLKNIVKEHYLQICPANSHHVPPTPKKRKL